MLGIPSLYSTKKAAAAIASAALFAVAVFTFPLGANAAGEVDVQAAKLIPNPSVENGTTSPNNWNQDSWGTNAAVFSYPVAGIAGQKAIQVKLTSYTSGDAKWSTKAVSIDPNTEYTFSNQYKSDVPTEIGVVYTLSNGNLLYDFIGAVSPSNSWKKTDFTFKTPSNASKASFYHLLNAVGTLTTDDYEVTKVPVAPPSNGAIRNGSMETAGANGNPQYWYQDSWGSNTAKFTYSVTGKAGKAARVEITAHTNGDAKWAFEDVDVDSNIKYRISNSYRSNVSTDIVARYTLNNGNLSYEYITTAPASSTWKDQSAELTTPSNTKSITVYHVINAKGFLETDEYSLTKVGAPPPPPPAGTIPNPDLESGSNGSPDFWKTDQYGTLDAEFTYPVSGKGSAKAAKVVVSNYKSGDAKWIFDDVKIASNATYEIKHDYNSNTATNITIRYTMNNGSFTYEGIETLAASSGWKNHSLQFTSPPNVKSFTLFHSAVANGSLTVDNYELQLISNNSNNFAEGMVSLTFDDGWSSQYNNALPILNDANVEAGFYIISQYTLNGYSAYVSPAQVVEIHNQGYEIGAHTRTHAHLTTLSDAQLNSEVAGSKLEIKNMGVPNPKVFIYPYGEKDTRVINAVKDAGFTAARGVERGYNTPKTNKFDLLIQEVNAGTTQAQIKSWIDKAKADKTWLILMFHQIDNSNAAYGTTPAILQSTTNYINQKNVKTVTLEQGVDLMQ